MNLTHIDDEILRDALEIGLQEIGKLQKEISGFQEKLHILYGNVQEISNEFSRRFFETCQEGSPEFITRILDGSIEDSITYEKYCKYLEKNNVFSGMIFAETNQRVISVAFSRKLHDKNRQVIEFIKKVLPYVKPTCNSHEYDDSSYKSFMLHEHTCSGRASYSLHINNELDVILTATRYGINNNKKIGNLEGAALEYLIKNHYYVWYEEEEND